MVHSRWVGRTIFMKQWKWFVYIIETNDGWYYTGMTWSMENRLEQHIMKLGSKFTRKHGVKRICFIEEFTNILDAREVERQIKDFSRKKKEALFNVNIPLTYSSNEVRSFKAH